MPTVYLAYVGTSKKFVNMTKAGYIKCYHYRKTSYLQSDCRIRRKRIPNTEAHSPTYVFHYERCRELETLLGMRSRLTLIITNSGIPTAA